MPATIANPAQTLPWRDWYGLQRWKKRAHHQLRTRAAVRRLPQARPDHAGDDRRPRPAAPRRLERLPPRPAAIAVRRLPQGQMGRRARGYRCDIGDDGLPIDPKHPFNALHVIVQRTPGDGPAAGELREGETRSALANRSRSAHRGDRGAGGPGAGPIHRPPGRCPGGLPPYTKTPAQSSAVREERALPDGSANG